jgi:hypothetical protein
LGKGKLSKDRRSEITDFNKTLISISKILKFNIIEINNLNKNSRYCSTPNRMTNVNLGGWAARTTKRRFIRSACEGQVGPETSKITNKRT